MTWYFAYGSNMSRAHMRRRCPGAIAAEIATLSDWRFVINPDGYGSIARRSGCMVHGVLWRLGIRDLAALNAYENVAGGLYLRRWLVVRHNGRRRAALVYVARRCGEGTPRPGYIALVVAAAREWALPAPYIRSLRRWSPSALAGLPGRDIGGCMTERVIRRVVIRGRVQRVGYRNWAQHVAVRSGIEGWVRNRADGSVEAVFAGTLAAVEAMIEACRRGPPKAQVAAVDIEPADVSELDWRGSDRFAVLPTA